MYSLDYANRATSCTPPGCPAQTFEKNLSESHMTCNNTLWNFFLLKKSQGIGVKPRRGLYEKKNVDTIYETTTFDKPVISQNCK